MVAETAARLVTVLEKYEGRDKPVSRSLPFVKDAPLRKILEGDLNELKEKVYPAKAWKNAVVLAGSILEGFLYDQLATDAPVRSKALSCSKAPKDGKGNVRDLIAGEWNLASMIAVATDLGILTKEREKSIDQVLRDYRNFVHPIKELRAGHSLDEPEAMMAVGALDGICKHLS